jgi:hypothetical protein
MKMNGLGSLAIVLAVLALGGPSAWAQGASDGRTRLRVQPFDPHRSYPIIEKTDPSYVLYAECVGAAAGALRVASEQPMAQVAMSKAGIGVLDASLTVNDPQEPSVGRNYWDKIEGNELSLFVGTYTVEQGCKVQSVRYLRDRIVSLIVKR